MPSATSPVLPDQGPELGIRRRLGLILTSVIATFALPVLAVADPGLPRCP